MKSILKSGSAAIVALELVAGPAHAAKLCKLTGSYSDDYGSTTSIKGKNGSILNTLVCATPYTFKISGETQTGFTVMGKNKTKSCGTFTAGLTFMGGCTVFGGSVVIGGLTLSDTFTKIPGSERPTPPSDLLDGLK